MVEGARSEKRVKVKMTAREPWKRDKYSRRGGQRQDVV
jgi:metal-sulfur cluster biosynthetic enzyme